LRKIVPFNQDNHNKLPLQRFPSSLQRNNATTSDNMPNNRSDAGTAADNLRGHQVQPLLTPQTTSTNCSKQFQPAKSTTKAKSVHIQLPEPNTEVVRINNGQGPSSDVRNIYQQPLSNSPTTVRNSNVQGVQPEAASTRSKRVITKPKRYIN
jgi:hypothetical protein